MSCFLKRTWAEVDLDKIAGNFRRIRAYVGGGAQVMAVVKADAYGHGAPFVAKELDAAGANMFGVSNLEEAVQLRRCGVKKPVLILGYTPPDSAGELIAEDIMQTVFSADYASSLSAAACREEGKVKIHIKLDTGMSRIGFVFHEGGCEDCVRSVAKAASLPGLSAEGIFTHFAVSDEPENPYTQLQFDRFQAAVELLGKAGVSFRVRHCCNSAGLLNYPQMKLDLVRPGIILYGLTPAEGMPLPIELEPAMEIKTVLFQVKELEKGTAVSYGMKYVTPSKKILGTLPIGYADGFSRAMSNRADVLVNGRRARVVGRVCMDQCLIDITDIRGVEEGNIVTIIGQDGGERVTMEETARLMGTINYETACLVGKRVPRVFYKNGEIVGQQNYILP